MSHSIGNPRILSFAILDKEVLASDSVSDSTSTVVVLQTSVDERGHCHHDVNLQVLRFFILLMYHFC